jgi:KRAB domain-containing zinc finger protein
MNLKHIEQKSKPFKCDRCDKLFAYANSLVSHKLLHTVGKPYECEFCDYAAAQKGNLKTHRLKLHKDSV